MSDVPGYDFTVAELKKALRARGLPTSGVKLELIKRLSEHDPNVWAELMPVARSTLAGDDASPENDGESESRAQSGASQIEESQEGDMTGERKARERAMRREIELLRREKECAERERRLLQRELEILRSSPAAGSVTSAAQGGVRSIKKLLPEFDGTNNTFWRWKQ
ncbi:uncharacterized protein [Cardiocondyla obscurior]|uniref:uncharacterized protein n=1 Tax=Cardiocondyla obscurior TaxID=286306 RepID=UPI00396566BF